MKYFKQAFIIIVITLISEVLSHVLPLPLSASIYGMVILFICLMTGVIKLEQVENVGEWLIADACVRSAGSVLYLLGKFTAAFIIWSVIISVTTILVMAVLGLIAQSLQKRQNAKHGGENNE